jgi:hypothetical protein
MTSSTLDQIDSKMKSKILIPAIGLEQIQVLPFTTSNLKKAVLQDQEIEGPGWLVFSGFDISKLKTVDKHRYPIRVQVDNNTLVLKMVTKIHECMHGTLMGFIIGELAAMGLVSGLHYASMYRIRAIFSSTKSQLSKGSRQFNRTGDSRPVAGVSYRGRMVRGIITLTDRRAVVAICRASTKQSEASSLSSYLIEKPSKKFLD